MISFKNNDPTTVLSTSILTLLTHIMPTLEFRDVGVYLTPTGATMTEFYIDALVPGTGTPALPGQAVVAAEWVTVFSHADDETDKEVRRWQTVNPGNVTTGVRAVAWFRLPPTCGVRIRGKASGAGTVDVRLGIGHS